jgi:hypothetical protein
LNEVFEGLYPDPAFCSELTGAGGGGAVLPPEPGTEVETLKNTEPLPVEGNGPINIKYTL